MNPLLTDVVRHAADLAFAAARRTALCISMAGIAAAMPGGMRDVLAADAEPYPSRPIRLVVPSAPGTGDVAPRLIAGKLAEALGQPVILENRPGASYNIASDAVAKAAPDGHTLLWTGSVITVLPSVLGPTAVDPVKSLSPVAKVLRMSLIVVVHPSLGVRTLDELLALARQKPGQIAYATPGIGTIPHLVATMIEQRAGVELLHVPYTNAGQLLKDLLAGEVPVYFTFQVAVDSYLKAGTLRALAVASTQRAPTLPEVPSLFELGFKEASVDPWIGILAPAGTPREIVGRLNHEIGTVLQQPDVRERLVRLGMEPQESTPEGFAVDIREAVARWPAIVKAAGIRRD